MILSGFLLLTAAAVQAAPGLSPRQIYTTSGSNSAIVDLGSAGKWQGSLQANNTVKVWRAIPYAAPPVGQLRYKAPQPLASQNSTVQDVSQDFPGIERACVQFGTTSYVGVNAGPGVEDCLYLYIWAPANAKEGDKLAVRVFTHGGGMQNSQSANNDMLDFTSQAQNLMFVNANYRLGHFGFANFVGSIEGEDQPGNLGLLDSRFAQQWVQKYISKFGGDPNNIAIDGQSGGGGSIMTQLLLYNGTNPPFQKAMARSIQQINTYNITYLRKRNDAFAAAVNCSSDSSSTQSALNQVYCMRNVSAKAIQTAALAFGKATDENGYSYPGWLPAIDFKTLSDTPSRLYAAGQFAKVPVMPVAVSNEFARFTPAILPNISTAIRASLGPLASPALLQRMLEIYPAPITNGSYNTGAYADDLHRFWSVMDDSLAKCAAPMVARAYSKAGLPAYEARFDAPQPGYPSYDGATHSSDNFYLQNATASYNNQTMVNVALEWRAYVSSFMRFSDPNAGKLNTSRTWVKTQVDDAYEPRMHIQMALASSPSGRLTNSAMELQDAAEYDRCAFWLSQAVTDQTRQ